MSSADHVAPVPVKPRRRRSNRGGNRRAAAAASRPPAVSSSQPSEDWTPPTDSLENGVADNGANDDAKPQRRPRDRVSDAAVTTKH